MIRVAPDSYGFAIRQLLAVLAIAGQILLGAVVPVAAAEARGVALFGLGDVICHAPNDFGAPDSRHDRRNTDCAICPLCVSLAPVAVVMSAPPRVPVDVAAVAIPAIPAARVAAPPSVPHDTPPPRGPPTPA